MPGRLACTSRWIIKSYTSYRLRTLFLKKKIKDFSRTPFSAKKNLESMSFLVLPQHDLFYPEGLSVFAFFSLEFYLNYKVSIEIQGLSSTDCNFQGLSRPWIFILKFKDFQGAYEPSACRWDLRSWWVQLCWAGLKRKARWIATPDPLHQRCN